MGYLPANSQITLAPDHLFALVAWVYAWRRTRRRADDANARSSARSRFASDFAQDQINNISQSADKPPAIRATVDHATEILADEEGSIGDLGHLLHESWQLKRELAANVSNRQIDEIYDAGRAAGALGGKLLGAGSGGFMVFLVDPSKREPIRERLKNQIHVSIGIDSEGSRIVLYQPNGI